MRKLVVVGNGAVGMLAAIQLKQSIPSAQVSIIGPTHRPHAASLAAGAMANVFAEVEKSFTGSNSETDLQVETGLAGRSKWRRLLTDVGREDAITAESTIVYLKFGCSDFERANFDMMSEYVLASQSGRFMDTRELDEISSALAKTAQSSILIQGEFAYDSAALFQILDELADELGIKRIDARVNRLDSQLKRLMTDDGDIMEFDFAIVAAGVQSSKLTEELGCQPMLQGVGSAILLEANRNLEPLGRHVIRTVNRGGAQCGVHTVPRVNGGIYLGAGNYIVQPGDAEHRIETVRYLFSTFEREYIGSEIAYPLTGRFVKGYRPRSLDGYPMVGPFGLAPEVIMCTSMNRVGLTWAPHIADAVVKYVQGAGNFEGMEHWRPDRDPTPFGTQNQALEYFVESRLGAAIEHGLVPNEAVALQQRTQEIRSAGRDLLRQVATHISMPGDSVIHPESWRAILEEPANRCDQ